MYWPSLVRFGFHVNNQRFEPILYPFDRRRVGVVMETDNVEFHEPRATALCIIHIQMGPDAEACLLTQWLDLTGIDCKLCMFSLRSCLFR